MKLESRERDTLADSGRRTFLSVLLVGLGISLCDAMNTGASESIEYSRDGNKGIARARGFNLDTVHTQAVGEFHTHIRREIATGRFILSGFSTSVQRNGDVYTVEYSIHLNPVPAGQRPQTIMEVVGSVWEGNAKFFVDKINAGDCEARIPGQEKPWMKIMDRIEPDPRKRCLGKIRPWQEKSRRLYEGVYFEKAPPSGDDRLFHEAVLLKAEGLRQ